MSCKPKGLCPFCKKSVTPTVVEENDFRRDKCKCPECSNYIYICRMPGCDDYAKGGEIWDDEFCSKHTNATISAIPTFLGLLAGVFGVKNKNKTKK